MKIRSFMRPAANAPQLNAAKGTDYDPQLLAECREKGIIPPLTSPNGGN
jgi:hypothetical protein